MSSHDMVPWGETEPLPFPVNIRAHARNGYLVRAAKKLGTQRALAAKLGVAYSTVCAWVRMQERPSDSYRPRCEAVLLELCGELWETIFPIALKEIDPAGLKMETEVTMSPTQLLASSRGEAPSPLEALLYDERRALAARVLSEMNPRSRQVLEMRAEGFTLAEVGTEVGLSPERVRQVALEARNEAQARVARIEAGMPEPVDLASMREAVSAERYVEKVELAATRLSKKKERELYQQAEKKEAELRREVKKKKVALERAEKEKKRALKREEERLKIEEWKLKREVRKKERELRWEASVTREHQGRTPEGRERARQRYWAQRVAYYVGSAG